MPGCAFHAPDLPGHGAAPDWDGKRDYMSQSLDRALAAMPEGPMDVVGHSYGGCVALRLAVEHPGRVRSLTLVEPVLFAAADRDAKDRHWSEMTSYDAALDAGDRRAAAEVFTGIWGMGVPLSKMPERQAAYIVDRIHLIRATAPGIAGDIHGIVPRLPSVASPVLIVTRVDPPEIVAAIRDGLTKGLSQVRHRAVGDGHMVPMTTPEALAGALEAFWAGV